MSLDTLLSRADIVTLHLHLDEDTLGLLGREQFARIKRGSYLVNTARGELVDEEALLDALREGRLAGAGCLCSRRRRAPPCVEFRDALGRVSRWGGFQPRALVTDIFGRHYRQFGILCWIQLF